MATIQIRDVPEEAYEELRAAAEREGKSLQSFMRDRTVEWTREARKRAALDAVRDVQSRYPGYSLTRDEIVAEVRAIRGE